MSRVAGVEMQMLGRMWSYRCLLLLSAAAAGLWGAPARAAEGKLEIKHAPVACVIAERYPQLDACVEPSVALQSARVYFKAEGVEEFHFVDMIAVGACYRATLPAPRLDSRRVRYYLVATAEDGRSAQTREQSAAIAAVEASCPGGVAAPFLSSATVAVGGGGLPEGFVSGKGMLSGAGGKAAVAGVVGAGALGAVLALGGGGDAAATGGTSVSTEPPATSPPAPPTTQPPPATTTTTTPPPTPTTTTTTRPPAPTTTTTTTRPPAPTTTTTTTPTTTTTTTTQPSPCLLDAVAPTVDIRSPRQDAKVGAQVAIEVDARDRGATPVGIDFVRLYAEEQNGDLRKVAIATLRGAGPLFQATWVLPKCNRQGERWRIYAEAADRCSHAATDNVRIQREDGVCPKDVVAATEEKAPAGPRAAALTSELGLQGAAAQVVVNGVQAAFPGGGTSELVLPVRRGENRVEGLLVDAAGVPGTWRFRLTAAVRPGSLRAVAGEPSAVGADEIAFTLQGRPGERVVFVFQLE